MVSRLLACAFLSILPADATFLRPNEGYAPPAKMEPSKAAPAPLTAVLPAKASQDPYAVYDGKYIVKVSACNQSGVDAVTAALNNTDCVFLSDAGMMQLPSSGCGVDYVVCSAEIADKLADEGVTSIVTKDSAALVHGMAAAITTTDAGFFFRDMGGTTHEWDSTDVQAAPDFYSSYRSLEAIEKRMKDVVDASGGLASLEELSPKTHEGRTIKAVRIRDAQWTPGRPRLVLTFQLHAREWITGMVGCYTAEHLIQDLKQERYSFTGMEVVLVPISNPDGFVYSATTDRMWRKNRRNNGGHGCVKKYSTTCNGVDLNRNFESPDIVKAWPWHNCCSGSYNGPSALSEPESQALGRLIEEAPTLVHIDVHSYGQWVLGPYSYTTRPHREKSKIDKLGVAMRNAIAKVHGTKYTYATSTEQGAGAVSGTIADWSTSKGAYSYIYELRPLTWPHAFTPPADQIRPTAEESLQGIYTALDWANGKVPTK